MFVESLKYQSGQNGFESQLVYSEGELSARPLLLISPSWLGVTANALERAKQLVDGAYVGLVVDIYGGGKSITAGPEEAAPLANALREDWSERRARMGAAYQALIDVSEKRGLGDPSRVAAIGYCFGGGNVLELARHGADLKALVCIHGDLTSPKPAKAGGVRPAVLILHGSADPVEPKHNREAIEAELTQAGANWQMHTFGGLVHSYCEEEANVPGIAQYNAAGARQSMRLAKAFLEDAFAGQLDE